ncbi:MAG: MGMT family protein [Thermoplasmata archaeon]|nr:MGMT family protein [Thermoplasmata archaeon]MCI4356952.1 MGMT family protein [Thermoplasmata archaeon]
MPGAHRVDLARFRHVIASVPRGRVITYGEVAAAAGHPGAARLTVSVLRSESGLPWHRVVAAGGRIALKGEEGLEQRLRLELEGLTFRGKRVRMDRHAWRPRRARQRPAAGRQRGRSGPSGAPPVPTGSSRGGRPRPPLGRPA